MEPQIILSGVTLQQLRELIVDIFKEREALKEEVKNFKFNDNIYLSRKEVAKTLQVSLPTLRQYVMRGIIQSHRIGKRILFKSQEVEKALTAVTMHNKYRKGRL